MTDTGHIITERNADTIRHALEMAIRRGAYTEREVAQLREAADLILLAQLDTVPAGY